MIIIIRINKFFEIGLTIKVNIKRERRFDCPTVIFKFKMRGKICAYIQLYNNWLHESTLTSTCGGTQTISNWQSCKGRAWTGSRDH